MRLITILILRRPAMKDFERIDGTPCIRLLQPHKTNPDLQEVKRETAEDKQKGKAVRLQRH